MKNEKNNKKELLEYVKENWKNIPYLCRFSEEEIQRFVESGYTNKNENSNEYVTIEKKGSKEIGEKEYERISSYILDLDEYGEEEYFLTSIMEFGNDGQFRGTTYGDIDMEFKMDEKGEPEFIETSKNKEKIQIINKLRDNKTVETHFGDDLDNKSSIYAVESLLKDVGVLKKEEKLNIERVPAGRIKEGYLNIDTGGHVGNKFDQETIIVDGDPKNGVKSACQALAKMGVYVPEQIYELADSKPIHISSLDSRSGLALVRYLSGEQAFKLAERELLDKSLTDKELKYFGLTEAHEKQQQIIDNAVEKINKYTNTLENGEKIVLAPETIMAGSSIAYEMGIPYYASTATHHNKEGIEDGVTFAIACKPGMKLPNSILEYGKELVEKYRIDAKSSGVFINPNEELIVAGGAKNPDFKIEGYTSEKMLNELKSIMSLDQKRETIDKMELKKVDEQVTSIERKKVLNELEKIKNQEKDIENKDYQEEQER